MTDDASAIVRHATVTARPRRSDVSWLHPHADIIIIGLDTPHKSLDEHPLYDSRVHNVPTPEGIASVRKDGVLDPCTVRKDGPKYQTVDGRGRIIRARIVCDEEIARGVSFEDQIRVPCRVVRGDDFAMLEMSRKLNSDRTDVTLLDIGTYAEFMQRRYGRSVEEIAAVFAVSPAQVRNGLSLLNLGESGVAALKSELLSTSAAVVVSKLAREDQDKQIEEIKADAAKGIKPTVERLNEKVREKLGKDPAKTPRARVGRATEALTKFADAFVPPSKNATREELSIALKEAVKTLGAVSRALTDKTLAKLSDTGD